MARETIDGQMERTTNGASVACESLSPAARRRQVGHRVTAQRLSLLGAFATGEHGTVDEVFARLEPLAPAVICSTVCRTLELFRDLGLVTVFSSCSP
jgi:Fe2+ or Zn2+ uptake regulation protein